MKPADFSPLPVAVRAFAVPVKPRWNGRQRRRRGARDAPTSGDERAWLVFDTETRPGPGMAFLFGVYQYLRGDLSLQEGIVYADDLLVADPEGFAILQEYVRTQPAIVDSGGSTRLRLLSRSEFVRKVLVEAINGADAAAVGFNLPFDISRLAVHHGEARGSYEGGFSFALKDYEG
jgi:hypothetical protein